MFIRTSSNSIECFSAIKQGRNKVVRMDMWNKVRVIFFTNSYEVTIQIVCVCVNIVLWELKHNII
jgi:hypothetical protein